jgi:hypothetical protein
LRYTLLELTQRILESMESDEVSDINETPEATSVANIIKECYFDIVGELNMAEQEGLFKLTSSGDNTKPVLMYMPATVSRVQYLKYNVDAAVGTPNYRDLRYLSNDEFLYYQTGVDPTDAAVDQMTVELNGVDFVFQFRNDRYPTYYTIFDEQSFVFDAFDVTVEDTLTQVRTLGYGSLVPSFTLTNTWTPDLDPRQFQLLLQDAKATAFTELKQIQNPTAEKKARKNRILTQKNKNDNDPRSSNQDHAQFGRKGRNPPMYRAMRQGV